MSARTVAIAEPRVGPRRGGASGRWLIAPFALGLFVLVAGPALVSGAASLFRYDLITAPEFVGFDNYARLLSDEVFRLSLRESMTFVGWAVPIRAMGAVLLALVLFRPGRGEQPGRGGGIARTTTFLPSVMPDVAYALVWLWILNPVYGPLNLVLGGLGIGTPAWLTTPGSAQAAIVIMVAFQLGEGCAIALAARSLVPRELEEVAAVEGARRWATFRRVVFPLMLPALAVLVIRDVVFALQATFVPTLIVTDGGPPPYATTYLPLFIYREAFGFLRYGYASAATIVMLVITAAVVWLLYQALTAWRVRLSG